MISDNETTPKRIREGSAGTIRSVDKVVDILELLARESRGIALGEIARRLELNASTVHHLIATLKARNIIAQDERTKDYRIGYRLVGLVGRFLSGTELYQAGIGPVEQLRDRSGETTYLSVFQGREMASIISLSGVRPIQVRRVQRQGQSSLHSTASGKLLLAFLPRDDAAAMIAGMTLTSFTAQTMTDRASLEHDLALTRTRGYALDREEDFVGVECVAVPVFDASGECVAAVSVSYPAAPPDRTHELIELALDAAHQIAANLGAAPSRAVSR